MEYNKWVGTWNDAVKKLLSTMTPVHVELLEQDIEWYEDPDPARPWGRVRLEVRACLVDNVGHHPRVDVRCPESPLALPPGVVEAILDAPPGLHTRCIKCADCSYWMPGAGAQIPIERSEDLTWHDRKTGTACAAPVLPECTMERSRWRPITLFTACPLCGCEELSGTAKNAPARPDDCERYVKRQARRLSV